MAPRLIGRTLHRLTGVPERLGPEEATRALKGLLDAMAARAAGEPAGRPAPRPGGGRVRVLLEPAWMRRPQ